MLRLLYSLHFFVPVLAQFKKKQYLCNPFPSERKNTLDDHLDISSLLAFTEQQEALIAAQNTVTEQVMNNNQDLRKALKEEHSRAENLQEQLDKERAKNKALEARVDQLESRPVNVTGDYVETQRISKYIAAYNPNKRKKLPIPNNDPTLPLWEDNATYM